MFIGTHPIFIEKDRRGIYQNNSGYLWVIRLWMVFFLLVYFLNRERWVGEKWRGKDKRGRRCGGEERKRSFSKKKTKQVKRQMQSQHRLYTEQSAQAVHCQTPRIAIHRLWRQWCPWPFYPSSMSSSNLLSPVNASANISAKIPWVPFTSTDSF